MRCTILNRNYPPNGGITGHSANELAGYLEGHGVEVEVITIGLTYGVTGGLGDKVYGSATSLKTLYSGKQRYLRLIASVIDGVRMANRAFTTAYGGPVICMTDPALLPCWVSRKAAKNNRPWFYWSMDLYPEAFLSSGLASEQNPVYRWLYKNTRASTPDTLIALGQQQADFIKSTFGPLKQTIILPCGISDVSGDNDDSPEWYRAISEKIVFGYVGNLGEAHDADFIIEVMKSINPQTQHFILVGYGVKADKVCTQAYGIDGVTVLDRVEREHLRFIDVHLATLLPEWDHVCVPSKAVSAVCQGGCLILCCSEENDNWKLLYKASWRVDPRWPTNNSIPELIGRLSRAVVSAKKTHAQSVRSHLLDMKSQGFAHILEAIRQVY
jgi:glycosyltransferase involved in cell wall biosynthesis